MLFRLYHPEIFQGSLRKKHYFEGWYFKHVKADTSCTIVIIPGISLAGNDPHSFIQIMDGGAGQTYYIRYSTREFRWNKNRFFIKVGNSEFTAENIKLNVENETITAKGNIEYQNSVKYPRTLFSPGIMGWYSFVPFMECSHGIVSVIHDLKGSISINGGEIVLAGGKGYIEKDWGTSFPESWIWIQSSNFPEHDTSFSFSVAKIPWLGSFFIGFIAFLYLGGRFYLFSTYNRSEVSELKHDGTTIRITLVNKQNRLNVRVTKNSFGDLRAPVEGEMSRKIKESIDSEVKLQLLDRHSNLEYEGTGKNVGLEVVEKIFEYF